MAAKLTACWPEPQKRFRVTPEAASSGQPAATRPMLKSGRRVHRARGAAAGSGRGAAGGLAGAVPPAPHGRGGAAVAAALVTLGANLFYNSPMEACVVICRKDKPAKRRGQVIFIDAVNEVTRERSERSMSYLKPEHQQRIADAYHAFKDVEGFARLASLADIRANDGNLGIPLYVRGKSVSDEKRRICH